MTTPKLTPENATDWRTPDGVRVLWATSLGGGKILSVKFASSFCLDARRDYPNDHWNVYDNGLIPYNNDGKGIVLVYDPLPKVDPGFYFTGMYPGNTDGTKYLTQEDAENEAQKLAAKRGKRVYVFKAVAAVQLDPAPPPVVVTPLT